MLRYDSDRRDGEATAADHLGEVPGVEPVLVGLAHLTKGRLELAKRVRRALGVRVVSREHEQLRSSLFDHPANRLSRVGRELQMLLYVLRWLHLQLLQRRLGFG